MMKQILKNKIEKIVRAFLPKGQHSADQERMMMAFVGVQFMSFVVALGLSYFVWIVQTEKAFFFLMVYVVGAAASLILQKVNIVNVAFGLGAVNLSVMLVSVGLLLGRPGAVWVYFIGSLLGSHFFLSLNRKVQLFADICIGGSFVLYLVLEWLQVIPTEIRPDNLVAIQHFGTINIVYAIFVVLGFVSHFYSENQSYRKKIERQSEVVQGQYNMIALILNNMKQAIFAIDSNRKVVAPVSKYATEIFGRDIEGEFVHHLIFDFIDDAEVRARCDSTLDLVFGEDELNWQMLVGNLPLNVKVAVGLAHKDLKISYSDLRDDNGNLDKILFVIEDITEVNRLTEEIKTITATKNRELKIVEQVYQNEPPSVASFIKSALRLLSELKTLIKDCSQLESCKDCARILHTIKGNARALGFQFISSRVHDIESELNARDVTLDRIKDFVHEVEKLVEEYRQVAVRLFGFGGEESHDTKGDWISHRKANWFRMKSRFEEFASLKQPMSSRFLLQEFEALNEIPVVEIVNAKRSLVKEMCQSLKKDVELLVQGDFITFASDTSEILDDVLTHLLRNAIDHGIEPTEVRQKLGKPSKSKVEIVSQRSSSGFVISVADDGRGIDKDKLRNKAITAGLIDSAAWNNLNENEQYAFIFKSGFSTLDEVNEYSGRGLGLDVVMSSLMKKNGRIRVQSTPGRGTTFFITISPDGAGLSKAS